MRIFLKKWVWHYIFSCLQILNVSHKFLIFVIYLDGVKTFWKVWAKFVTFQKIYKSSDNNVSSRDKFLRVKNFQKARKHLRKIDRIV